MRAVYFAIAHILMASSPRQIIAIDGDDVVEISIKPKGSSPMLYSRHDRPGLIARADRLVTPYPKRRLQAGESRFTRR